MPGPVWIVAPYKIEIRRPLTEESGPNSGHLVLLFHGWPDDIRTWDGVVACLHGVGFRTIAPYLRGSDRTRFLSPETMRSGQLAAFGSDIIEFAQALRLQRFAPVGHVSSMVALTVGYGTSNPDQQLPFQQAKNYWYHWYFCIPRGVEMLENSRHELCQYM